MSAYDWAKNALAKRAEYHRTRREIEALAPTLANEELGLNPYDAKTIAKRAVYG